MVYKTVFQPDPAIGVLYREYGYTTGYTFVVNLRNQIQLDKLQPGKSYELNVMQLYSSNGFPGLSTVIVERTYGKYRISHYYPITNIF